MNSIHLRRTLLMILGAILCYMLYESLSWAICHDTNTFLYATKMFFKEGLLPYKDIHEENTPMTYIIYYSIGWLWGITDLGFRVFDIFFCLFLILTWYFFSTDKKKEMAAGVFFYIFIYFCLAQKEGLQREHLFLLPLSLYFLFFEKIKDKIYANIIVGMTLGFYVCAKPTLVLILLPAFLSLLLLKANLKNYVVIVLSAFIPFFVSILFLNQLGIIHHFLDLAQNYWPLYGKFNFEQENHFSLSLALSMKRHMFFPLFGRGFSALPLLILVLVLLSITIARKIKWDNFDKILVLHYVFFIIYPALNKLYLPHYFIPFWFLSVILIMRFLAKINENRVYNFIFVTLSTFLLFAFLQQGLGEIPATTQNENVAVSKEQVKTLKELNFSKLRDQIQPIGWAGGASLLTLNSLSAQMPTRFIYAQHFFNAPQSDYGKKIRSEFMNKLKNKPPRFILIDPLLSFYFKNPIHVTPEDLNFPDFFNFLFENYRLVKAKTSSNDGLIENSIWYSSSIWELKT